MSKGVSILEVRNSIPWLLALYALEARVQFGFIYPGQLLHLPYIMYVCSVQCCDVVFHAGPPTRQTYRKTLAHLVKLVNMIGGSPKVNTRSCHSCRMCQPQRHMPQRQLADVAFCCAECADCAAFVLLYASFSAAGRNRDETHMVMMALLCCAPGCSRRVEHDVV